MRLLVTAAVLSAVLFLVWNLGVGVRHPNPKRFYRDVPALAGVTPRPMIAV